MTDTIPSLLNQQENARRVAAHMPVHNERLAALRRGEELPPLPDTRRPRLSFEEQASDRQPADTTPGASAATPDAARINDIIASDPNPNVQELGRAIQALQQQLAQRSGPGGGDHYAHYSHMAQLEANRAREHELAMARVHGGGGGHGPGNAPGGGQGQGGGIDGMSEAQIREAVQKALEPFREQLRASAPAAAESAAEAGRAIEGVRQNHPVDDWNKYAKKVAEFNNKEGGKQSGVDAYNTRRYMGAPRRWGWKALNGIFNIGAAKAGIATGAYFGLTAKATGALTGIGAFGLTMPPLGAALVVGAGLAIGGVTLWQLVRSRIGAFKRTDKKADQGWEAKKLMKESRRRTKTGFAPRESGLSSATDPTLEQIHDRIKKIGKWRRGYNIMPGLLMGGAVGAYSIDAAYNKGDGVSWLKTLGEEKLKTIFGSGTEVVPGTRLADYASAESIWGRGTTDPRAYGAELLRGEAEGRRMLAESLHARAITAETGLAAAQDNAYQAWQEALGQRGRAEAAEALLDRLGVRTWDAGDLVYTIEKGGTLSESFLELLRDAHFSGDSVKWVMDNFNDIVTRGFRLPSGATVTPQEIVQLMTGQDVLATGIQLDPTTNTAEANFARFLKDPRVLAEFATRARSLGTGVVRDGVADILTALRTVARTP